MKSKQVIMISFVVVYVSATSAGSAEQISARMVV